jgi:hypothetical protein
MDEIINGLLGPQIRKWIAAACGAWILYLVEHGVLTQPQIDTVIQAVVAIGLFLLVSFFTWAMNKIKGKVSVTIPKVDVPVVKMMVKNQAGIIGANRKTAEG